MQQRSLNAQNTALLLVDLQEKLVPHVERSCELLAAIQKAIRGFQILNVPLLVSEQYPEGLGQTLPAIRSLLGDQQLYHPKTSFSCLGDDQLRKVILSMPQTHWVLIGIEAHVCILQTAKSLAAAGKQVVVLNDAISSRSIYDFSTAIAEMRDGGMRISSVETLLFELLQTSQALQFKKISQLLK